MEHRNHQRLSANIEVLLYHNAIPVAHCRTHDIGRRGMFIQAGPLSYRENTRVTIEINTPSNSGSGPKRYRLPAIVVHASTKGMGLMFRESDSEAYQVAVQILARIVGQSTAVAVDFEPSPICAVA